MRSKENYTPYVAAALILAVGIFLLFQVYIFREPERIAEDEKRDALIATTIGRGLYAENCATCHGDQGEGVDGPPLNDKTFLTNTSNETIISLIGSGVPSSEMPAWGQVHGGPFTAEEVDQVAAFIRAWESDAPDRLALAMEGDSVNGQVIYSSTCIVCHGETGLGTETAPALNNPDKLPFLDDQWYFDTISDGRSAQGMPTWGTVLSPTQIRDLVALLRVWERGETVEMPGPEDLLAEALHLLGEGDAHSAEHELETAKEGASGEVLSLINDALGFLEAGDMSSAEEAISQALELTGGDGAAADDHDEAEADEHDDTEDDKHGMTPKKWTPS